MQKKKFLRVQFDAEISQYEITAFRGAIAGKVGRAEVLFHNHEGDRLRYGYPLIQYKRIGKQPTIMCIGDGVEEIHKYFGQKDWSITLHDRKMEMRISRLDMHQFTMQVWDKLFHYNIRNWIALNQRSWQEYQQMETVEEKTRLLETKLTGNILSFAKGIGWHVDKQIKCQVTDLGHTRPVRVKNNHLMAFNLSFRTNVFLPNFIGLGGKVSMGFGVVHEKRKNDHQEKG